MPPSVKPERFAAGKAVKGRNEPCSIGLVAWVLGQVHGVESIATVVEAAWNNTVDLFELDLQ
jgi:TatD DNase family protein